MKLEIKKMIQKYCLSVKGHDVFFYKLRILFCIKFDINFVVRKFLFKKINPKTTEEPDSFDTVFNEVIKDVLLHKCGYVNLSLKHHHNVKLILAKVKKYENFLI